MVAGLVAVLLVGCGDEGGEVTAKKPPPSPQVEESLKITLAERVNPEAVGFLMAEDRGYFEDEGLDVQVLAPSMPQLAIGYVVKGMDDFGVSFQPEVLLAQGRGAPITVVGSVIPQPTAAMIWLERSGVRGIADLKGKTIAFPGLSFQRNLLERILQRAGLSLDDVEVKAVEHELVPSLVDGDADAIFGGSANIEGVELEAAGLDPVITPVGSLGIPAYEELVLIARTDFAERNPQAVQGVIEAVRRGTAAAIEDPQAAAQVVHSDIEFVFENSWKETLAQVEATLPLLATGE